MKPKNSKKPSVTSRKSRVLMPQFDSMAQASSATGIPLAALKMAKSQGCDAFKHGRVDVGLFVRWWFSSQMEDANIDWGEELKKAQTLRERIRLAEDEKRTVDRGEVTFALNKGMSALTALLDRKFKVEGPPALKGRDEAFIQRWLTAAMEDGYDLLRSQLRKLSEGK